MECKLWQENLTVLQMCNINSQRSEEKSLSRVQLFETPWTVAYQAPPSMEFSRQEYWSGLPFSSPGDLSDPRFEPGSPSLQADSLPSEPPGNTQPLREGCGKCSDSCKELTHWKRLWCWEGLGAGEEGDDRGWDGWMASLTRTWVWVNSGSWWWTGRPGVLRFMGSQRVGHDWVTQLNWSKFGNKWRKKETACKQCTPVGSIVSYRGIGW